MSFLIIGGLAVNAYGHVRNTEDIDFLVVVDDVKPAVEILKRAGFTNVDFLDQVVFLRKPEGGVRVDLLSVERETFQQVFEQRQIRQVHGCEVAVPMLQNLISMKLFALANGNRERKWKDLPDILELSRIHDLRLEEDIKPLCQKFANAETYKMLEAEWPDQP